ncbi:MAG: putative selenate ABC transporter substrate-binding protein [Planctomycetes bacterium]|nr:putative selenate ABC transporter substrate-binding protein [Planctomycetota bacterium]
MRIPCPLLILPLLAATACGDTATEASSSQVLRFSAIPDENSTELQQKFDKVADYLSEQLGIEVQYVPSSSYGASVQAFKNGDIQLAWFGGLTGVQARAAVEGANAIAQGKVDPAYKSYFIAHKDSGIEPGEDFPMAIADKKFTFGSERSTSGRLMPEHFIRQATGKSPADFFGSPMQHSGGHDQTAMLVQAGTFDAGVLSYKAYDRLVKEGEIDPEVCRIVWTTPTYPDYNWTAHPAVNEMFGAGTMERLQKALIEMSAPELLDAVNRSEGLIAAQNSDFEPVVELATELGFLD